MEDWEQHQELAALGCDAVQGYLFSRPVSPSAMEELLASPQQVRRAASVA